MLAQVRAMHRLAVVVLALIAFCALSQSARSADRERRIALLIGNDTYPLLDAPLANAGADATDMGKALAALGFETTVRTNVARRDLYKLIDNFETQIAASPDTVAFFYYAGHGIEAGGKNYLIPTDGDIHSEADLEAEAVDADKVMRAMSDAHAKVNIVILDACRNNPLPKGRSLSRGLAAMQASRGTFVGFAAAPGQTALDSTDGGSNGVFTGVMLQQLKVPGLTIEQVFKGVIAGVKAKSLGKQTPWMQTSLQGNFYFIDPPAATAPPVAVAVAPAPPPRPKPAIKDTQFWDAIKDSTDRADFEDFLKRFPESSLVALAEKQLAKLEQPPPPPKPAADITGTVTAVVNAGRIRVASEWIDLCGIDDPTSNEPSHIRAMRDYLQPSAGVVQCYKRVGGKYQCLTNGNDLVQMAVQDKIGQAVSANCGE